MSLSPSLSFIESTIGRHPPADTISLELITEHDLAAWLDAADDAVKAWIHAARFTASAGQYCLVPGAHGIERVLVGYDPAAPHWCAGALTASIPPGHYQIANPPSTDVLAEIAMGWALGQYQFNVYQPARAQKHEARTLHIADESAYKQALNTVTGITLTRDLINTPAADMMPQDLSETMGHLAEQFGATWSEIVGEDLLKQNFPAIHAVGRASVHAPRLLDMSWGAPDAPKVTLVGKGVCFDSGGLDIKSAAGMRMMKKDMGGAAHSLGLAVMIMSAGLPVRLRVLIPAVENAISGSSFRPGDIVPTRAGINIEIENTDAEGRVVLSDALAEGGSQNPEVMIDFATLTGSARIALGRDLPAMFCNDDSLADGLVSAGLANGDPMWRMPLHAPYRELIESKIGDIMNGTPQPFGGSITAALFLEYFVPSTVAWAHFDIMAWNTANRPGRPEGGEAVTLRGILSYLQQRYAA